MDDAPHHDNGPRPGEDLYGLSVDELTERVALYEAEILRLQSEKKKKQAEHNAAHALFGSPSS